MNNSEEVIKVLREIADGLEAGKDVGITMAYVIPGETEEGEGEGRRAKGEGLAPAALGGHTIVSTYGQLATVLGMMELEKTYVQQRWLQSQLEAEAVVNMTSKLEEMRVAHAKARADEDAPLTMIGAEVSVSEGDPPASRLSPPTSSEAEAAPAG